MNLKIGICTVGGFEEVGKNMTAVKVDDDVFIFDVGFFLPGVIELQEVEKIGYTRAGLRRVGGIPDERVNVLCFPFLHSSRL